MAARDGSLRPMTKLLAFTDIHLKPEGETIIGIDPFTRLRDALAHGLRRHKDVARIILMGDLANSGRPAEYARLRTLLADCPVPVTLMPGNHDDRDALVEAFDLPRDENGFVQSVIDTPTHRVICLDTVFGTKYLSFASLGQYDAPRQDWLRAELARSDKPVLLFAHHPPMRVGFAGMDEIRLRDDDAFAAILEGSPVQHIICGHVHRTISGHWRGHGYTILKSTCHQMPLALENRDLSLSTDEPGAYGIVLLDEDGVTVHSEDFELASDEFVPAPEAVADS